MEILTRKKEREIAINEGASKLKLIVSCTHLIEVIKQHIEEDGVWQCEADRPARIAAVCVK